VKNTARKVKISKGNPNLIKKKKSTPIRKRLPHRARASTVEAQPPSTLTPSAPTSRHTADSAPQGTERAQRVLYTLLCSTLLCYTLLCYTLLCYTLLCSPLLSSVARSYDPGLVLPFFRFFVSCGTSSVSFFRFYPLLHTFFFHWLR